MVRYPHRCYVTLILTSILLISLLAACDSESKELTITSSPIPAQTLIPTVTSTSTSEMEEVTIVYEADLSNISAANSNDVMKSVIQIIERRLDINEVTKAVVQQKGDKQISVQLINVENIDIIIRLIGQVGKLEFKYQKLDAQGNPVTKNGDYIWILATGIGKDGQQIDLTGQYFKGDVSFMIDSDHSSANYGQPLVNFKWQDEAAPAFAEVTTRLIDNKLGIFMDDELISAPTIQEPITGGEGWISGLSIDEAKNLVIQLNSGALPVPLKIVSIK